MAAEASCGFKGERTPTGWAYAINPGRRVLAQLRRHLLAAVVARIVTGAFFFVTFIVMTRRPGWDLQIALLIPLALSFLAVGLIRAIEVLRRRTGRDELILDAEAIRTVWRLGPIFWSKTVRRADTAQLTVVRSCWSQASSVWRGEHYYALIAEDRNGRGRALVGNYSHEMLVALAAELSSRWKTLPVDPDLAGIGSGKLAVAGGSESPTAIRERFRPPSGTRLIFERSGKREVRISRPPATLSSAGAVCLLLAGAGALGVMICRTAPPIAGTRTGGLNHERLFDWLLVSVLVLVAGIGLVIAERFAIPRHELIASPESLALTTTTLIGTSTKIWRKPEIATIRVEIRSHPDSAGVGFHLLICASRGPDFDVANADAEAVVELLRKPKRTSRSKFRVVGRRTGPGTIVDTCPPADGEYDYALRLKTPATGLGSISPAVRMTVKHDEILPELSKSEKNWVATILREVLGLPA